MLRTWTATKFFLFFLQTNEKHKLLHFGVSTSPPEIREKCNEGNEMQCKQDGNVYNWRYT